MVMGTERKREWGWRRVNGRKVETGTGAEVGTQGRTHGGKGDGSGDGNESSSGDGNGDGIWEGGGEVKKRKKLQRSCKRDEGNGET